MKLQLFFLASLVVASIDMSHAEAVAIAPIYFGKAGYKFEEQPRQFGKRALTNSALRGLAARDLKAQVPRTPNTLRLSSLFITYKSPKHYHLQQTRVMNGRTLLFSSQSLPETPYRFDFMDLQIISSRGGVLKDVRLGEADLELEALPDGKARFLIRPVAVQRLKAFVESLPEEEYAHALQLVITVPGMNEFFQLPLQFTDLNRKAFHLSPGEDCQSSLAAATVERELSQIEQELGL